MVQFEVKLSSSQYNNETLRTLVEEDVLNMIIREHGKLISATWVAEFSADDSLTVNYRFVGTYKERRRGVQ